MAGRFTPCSRREFIRKLKALGYDGPFSGGKHEFMSGQGRPSVRVPNPHQGDISVDLLSRILRDSGIDREEWLKA